MLKYNIIPKPESYITGDSTYCVSSGTEVLCSEEFVGAGNYITEYLKTKPRENEGTVKFKKVGGMQSEEYSLKVATDGITVTASSYAGAFYGAVTLKMILMQAEKRDGKAIVSTLLIKDKPDCSYRGLMLDVSRHYFSVDIIKDLLRNMALLKLNKFHWHLSDDQGFRIESRLFPKLNEIGSKRKSRHLEGNGLKGDNEEYSHYYTQEEIKDIVSFAAKLNIEVIPEIDFPGHTLSILASYPELGCAEKEYEVAYKNGVMNGILCAGKEEVFDFIDRLLSEICPLFPSSRFHIGGDEAFNGFKIWETCERCDNVKKENNLNSSADMQIWFMNRVTQILKKYGKTPVAWDDCMTDGLDESVSCQFWQMKNMVNIKNQSLKRDIIVSPTAYFYFDVKYAVIPLKKVYNFNKFKAGFTKPEQRLAGLECEIWTEWIDGGDALDFAVYPRTAAFAEVGWTALENRNYKDFYTRLNWFKTYMRKKGINYSRVEKRMLGARQKDYYSLGADGNEYKMSMKLKSAEEKTVK